jgi:hypothetical protein
MTDYKSIANTSRNEDSTYLNGNEDNFDGYNQADTYAKGQPMDSSVGSKFTTKFFKILTHY